MLGFVGAATALNTALFPAPYSTPILLDDVLCLGDEEAVSQCHHRDWGKNNCGHYKDAGVVCQGTLCSVT